MLKKIIIKNLQINSNINPTKITENTLIKRTKYQIEANIILNKNISFNNNKLLIIIIIEIIVIIQIIIIIEMDIKQFFF
jgi:hypothetical protein